MHCALRGLSSPHPHHPKEGTTAPVSSGTATAPKGLQDTHYSSIIRKSLLRANSVPGSVFGTQICRDSALKKLHLCFECLQLGEQMGRL